MNRRRALELSQVGAAGHHGRHQAGVPWYQAEVSGRAVLRDRRQLAQGVANPGCDWPEKRGQPVGVDVSRGSAWHRPRAADVDTVEEISTETERHCGKPQWRLPTEPARGAASTWEHHATGSASGAESDAAGCARWRIRGMIRER